MAAVSEQKMSQGAQRALKEFVGYVERGCDLKTIKEMDAYGAVRSEMTGDAFHLEFIDEDDDEETKSAIQGRNAPRVELRGWYDNGVGIGLRIISGESKEVFGNAGEYPASLDSHMEGDQSKYTKIGFDVARCIKQEMK
jgi:hypothetical protein